MALNSGTGESAVLEIEVDVLAFEKGMNDVQQKAAQSTNKINKQFEFMGNSVKKTFEQQTAAAKKSFGEQAIAAKASIMAAAGAVAAASLLVRKYFDLLARGTGEGGKAVKALEESFNKLGDAVGEQQASVWQPLFETVTKLNTAAAQSPNLISAAAASALAGASSILAMANAVGILKNQLARLVSGGSTEAEIRAGNEAMQAGNLQAGLRDAASGTSLGRALSGIGGSIGRAGRTIAGGVGNAVAMHRIRMEAAAAVGGNAASGAAGGIAAGARQGGGGGGGGGGRADPIWARVERERAASEQVRALQDQEAANAVAARGRVFDAWQTAADRRIDSEHETANAIMGIQQGLSNAQADLADAEIARAEEVGNAWRAQIEALHQMGQATLQVAAAQLLQSGSADEALRAGLSALGTMAGFRALFEAAEAIASAVTPGMQGFAAGHAKAAAMFGAISIGTALIGKAAYGSNYGRQSNGARGGGVADAIASPRSSGDRGGGSQKVETTYIIKTSGDILDSDRALRKLARHMRDIDRRR